MMEWLHQAQYSLVIFTLFTQVSVGAFWVLLMSASLKLCNALIAAGLGLVAVGELATRMVKPMQPKVETKTYGYKKVNLS